MSRGDRVIQRELNPAQLAQMMRDFDRIREKVEKFTGERGDELKPLSAVRRVEFKAIGQLGLSSLPAVAAPTQDEFNALQKDVQNIFEALRLISNALGNTTIPKV